MFHIVLYEPEIPQNAGNIARTCAATNCHLHLIKPLGFRLNDKYLKRAGLDYWEHVHWQVHDDFASFLASLCRIRIHLFTTKASTYYHTVEYLPGDALVFGPETRGLPEILFQQYPQSLLKIPQSEKVRSLNLANAVNIALYDALRQNNVPGML